MKKYKYIKISKTKKLRYISNYFKKNLYIIFLPGFASDIEGKKPKTLKKYAVKKKLGFLSLEYSGHGKSSGIFKKGNISTWSNDAKIIIKKIVGKNNFILVGSSMGAWLSLILFKSFSKQIKGFIGIGPAPEFTTRLMWNKFNNTIKKQIKKNGEFYLKNDQYSYIITHQLIKDGRKKNNKVLNKKIKNRIFVTMIHGSSDKSVPIIYSKKVLSLFPKSFKKLKIIKKGNHSLSSNKNLKIILSELSSIVKKIIN